MTWADFPALSSGEGWESVSPGVGFESGEESYCLVSASANTPAKRSAVYERIAGFRTGPAQAERLAAIASAIPACFGSQRKTPFMSATDGATPALRETTACKPAASASFTTSPHTSVSEGRISVSCRESNVGMSR